jgi:23S rRNA pseudouridine1911/1915/1917 synthase
VTHYEVVEEFPDADVTLLEVTLETGRTHQIRVHLSAIDHPVIGDRAYSKPNKMVSSPRIFLHSRTVRLRHPSSGEDVSYTAPLPADLSGVLASLGAMTNL